MTQRISKFRQLIARLVSGRSCGVALRATGAYALTCILSLQAQAQLTDGLVVPGSEGVVGSSAIGYGSRSPEEMAVDVGIDNENGVFVGPGGATSATSVPSVLGPAIDQPIVNHYVQQPYANGPFVQQQPVVGQADYGIPCPCDAGCDVSYYGRAEALYFRRDHDERFTLSRDSRIPPFDYELGGRLTVGRLMDCVNGYEFSYAGPFKWTRQVTRAGAALQSNLRPVGLLPAAVASYNDATFHSQGHEARLNSYEANRRWWAWDVFSALIGVRVIDYRESYGFLSTSPAGAGLYLDRTKNLLVGPQIGGDLLTPIGLRTLIGMKGKASVMGNFARNELNYQNAGFGLLDAVDSDIKLAGLIEFGGYAKYSITPSIRVQGGYEFWYVPGVATVPGQSLQFVTPQSGEKVNAKEELLLHGASVGAEILF